MRRRATTRTTRTLACVAGLAALALPLAALQPAAAGTTKTASGAGSVDPYSGLTGPQRTQLMGIARDTWNFYRADVDPKTNLPMDNLTYAGGATAPTAQGQYTSAANIGVYLWAVVSAEDLKLITPAAAEQRVRATLKTVASLKRYKGFLYQWYDTTDGALLSNPPATVCDPNAAPTFDNCSLISNVDNGWYASGLIIVRQAMPALAAQANSLIKQMDFSIFYDNRAETHCNVNPAIPGNQPTGQMYGAVYVGLPPTDPANVTHYYHNGALYSDPRISAYIGMGLHQMPGNVWWRSWRELPPAAPFADCATDPTSRGRASRRWAEPGRPSPIPSRTSSSRSGKATTPTPAPARSSSRRTAAACSRA
jgi:hypothetical protein